MSGERKDGHSWFVKWVDAIGQADRRAALTRRRYRVRFEPENRWWTIRETTIPLDSSGADA